MDLLTAYFLMNLVKKCCESPIMYPYKTLDGKFKIYCGNCSKESGECETLVKASLNWNELQ